MPSTESWPAALEKIKAAGYNAVALSFFWGYHSPRPGVYDFSGVRDVNRLLDLAAHAGLFVVAQPGPYIDGGAEAGGIPDWLLARSARAATSGSRYANASRAWLGAIDAILAKHQVYNGGGSVVLYEIGDSQPDPAALRRAARADGIAVPFTSDAYPVAYDGIDWGWTGGPLRAASAIAPPLTVLGWRSHADDAEALRVFDDQAWPPLLTSLPRDPDEGAPAPQSGAPQKKAMEFLGVDDYGFHHGIVWYRGHFSARGSERRFALAGMTGRGGALAAWLNGTYLGSATALRDGRIVATMTLPSHALQIGRDNVLAVLFENGGRGDDANRDVRYVAPRGMLHAAFAPAGGALAWRILGNGEYNTDPVRGPLNAGGLAGEIAGWQLPAFSDADWAPTVLPARATRAGVTWYRAHVRVNLPTAAGAFPALQIDDAAASRYRAFVYVNGWLVGKYVAGASRRGVFAIPPGVIANPGVNTIAIAVWTLEGTRGLGRVSLTAADAFPDAHGTLPDAPQVLAAGGVARLQLDVTAAPDGGRPQFVYRGVAAAPTIRVAAGDRIEITVRNRLPLRSDTPNAINLHFHGLNVSPARGSDDVLMTLARPGETLHYSVRVPRAQQPGLYWYHTHSHGEGYWQMIGGLSGAIVVEPAPANDAPSGLRERLLVVRDVQDAPSILALPWYARRMTPRYVPGAENEIAANRPCFPQAGMHVTVNGTVQPAIAIGEHEQERFGVLNATGSRVLNLSVDGERIGVVAFDGYALAAAAGTAPVLWTDRVLVPPGGRAEFLVSGQPAPTVLRSNCYDSGPAGDRDPAEILAVLRDAGGAEAASDGGEERAPFAAPTPIPLGPVARRRQISLSEDARGFYINGRAFDMSAAPAIVARAGTLEEWTVSNQTSEVHAFHIHQVHFLVEALGGVRASPQVWRDTVLVPPAMRRGGVTIPGSAKILVDFRNPAIRGTFVFHCHMLDHADGGMMALVKVV